MLYSLLVASADAIFFWGGASFAGKHLCFKSNVTAPGGQTGECSCGVLFVFQMFPLIRQIYFSACHVICLVPFGWFPGDKCIFPVAPAFHSVFCSVIMYPNIEHIAGALLNVSSICSFIVTVTNQVESIFNQSNGPFNNVTKQLHVKAYKV